MKLAEERGEGGGKFKLTHYRQPGRRSLYATSAGSSATRKLTTARVRNTISMNEAYSASLRNASPYGLCAASCAASNF